MDTEDNPSLIRLSHIQKKIQGKYFSQILYLIYHLFRLCAWRQNETWRADVREFVSHLRYSICLRVCLLAFLCSWIYKLNYSFILLWSVFTVETPHSLQFYAYAEGKKCFRLSTQKKVLFNGGLCWELRKKVLVCLQIQ